MAEKLEDEVRQTASTDQTNKKKRKKKSKKSSDDLADNNSAWTHSFPWTDSNIDDDFNLLVGSREGGMY